MTGRDISRLNVIGAALIGTALALAGLGVAVFGGCTPLPEPVEPEPQPSPPEPDPVVPPSPDPAPAATPCGRSCQTRERLGCSPPIERAACVERCELFGELQKTSLGDVSWHPDCQERSTTCEAWRACRGDGT